MGPEEVSRVRAGPRTFSLTLFSLPQMWKHWLALALVAVALVHGEVGDRSLGFARPAAGCVSQGCSLGVGLGALTLAIEWNSGLLRAEILLNLNLNSEVVWSINRSPTTPNMEGSWGEGREERGQTGRIGAEAAARATAEF